LPPAPAATSNSATAASGPATQPRNSSTRRSTLAASQPSPAAATAESTVSAPPPSAPAHHQGSSTTAPAATASGSPADRPDGDAPPSGTGTGVGRRPHHQPSPPEASASSPRYSSGRSVGTARDNPSSPVETAAISQVRPATAPTVGTASGLRRLPDQASSIA